MGGMRPLGSEDVDAKGMLRHPGFLNALAEYDGMHVSENMARDVCDLLEQVTPTALFDLAKASFAAYVLVRWLLAWILPFAPKAFLRTIKALQATERIVKCRVGENSFVHLCIHTSSNSVQVAGVVTDKCIND